MIDIKLMEDESYKKNLVSRGMSLNFLQIATELNFHRKKIITEAEQIKSKKNKIDKTIGIYKRENKDINDLMKESLSLGDIHKDLEKKSKEISIKFFDFLAIFPNKIHESVPEGNSSKQNKEIMKFGEQPKFSFKTREHFEIGDGILDFERAAKVTGARFSFLKGKAARLERAIIQYLMDLHSNEHGYQEIIPPYIVNETSYFGTGQFPKFKQDVFHIENSDYFLISTAEIPVTNYFRDEILNEKDLPISFCAFSPCFRSEAGAAGKDTRGLIRQHQFHKVELMKFSHPKNSYEELELLTSHAERCLKQLELPYRKVVLCSGDLGFSSVKTYDLEVWMPGANTYREISSCSNYEEFQARRANIRFRSNGKNEFVHTLNGSGLAVGRTLAAIIENYQNEDGTFRIPKVLQKYF